MNSEKTDVELAVLIAISSDRDLLNKAVDEGFRPELLRSSPGRITPRESPTFLGVDHGRALSQHVFGLSLVRHVPH